MKWLDDLREMIVAEILFWLIMNALPWNDRTRVLRRAMGEYIAAGLRDE